MEYKPEYELHIWDDFALLGLSLSHCVEDILDGKINRGKIVAMNTNTCMPTYESVKKVCKDNSEIRGIHSYEDWLDTTMFLILNTKFFQYRIWEPHLEEIGVSYNPNHSSYYKWLPVNRSAFISLWATMSQPTSVNCGLTRHQDWLEDFAACRSSTEEDRT